MKLTKIFILFSIILIIISCGREKNIEQDPLTEFLKIHSNSYDTNSVKINDIRIFLTKDILTIKDTIKFYQLAKLKQDMLKELDKKNIYYDMNREIIDSSKSKPFVVIPRRF